MQQQLEITGESGLVDTFALDQQQMIIGRSSTAEIRIHDPTVSRQHAQLSNTPAGWVIKDLGSRSGTFVNGQRIQEQFIRPGDHIQVCGYTLRMPGGSTVEALNPGFSTIWTNEDTTPDISTLSHGVPPKIGLSHIAALNSFGESQHQEPDREERLLSLCRVVAGDVLDGQWAFALQLNNAHPNRPPEILAAWPADLLKKQDVHISRTTINAMLQGASPVLASNFNQTEDLVEMSIVEGAPESAVAACPLDSDEELTRLLYVSLSPQIATTEWLAVISLAGKEYQQAEAAWREREALKQQAVIKRDLENARAIQTSILPERPQLSGLDIAWSFQPCDAVGGDFIDLLTLPDGRLLIAIADVAGHGLASALTTLSIHSILQTSIKSGMDVPQMMETLNEHLCAYMPDGRFVTMLVLLIDPVTGQTECLSAGHHAPIVVSPNGQARELKHGSDLVLGVAPVEMTSQADRIEQGERLLLYTDGLIEMQKPQGGMLHTQGLTDLFAGIAEFSDASTLTQSLREKLDELQGDQPILDDQTFVVLHRSPAK